MPKSPEFEIHVDSSCLTDPPQAMAMSPDRITSNQAIVHYDPRTHESHHDIENAIEVREKDDKTQQARDRQIDRIEAKIQAAARALVASMEQDSYVGTDESVLSTQTDESYHQDGTEMTYEGGTELTYGDETEVTQDFEQEGLFEIEGEGGDSSSHHDGDIDDDDVFSDNSGRSGRSSLDSCHNLQSSDETQQQKELTSPAVGEEAAIPGPGRISRIPSEASFSRLPDPDPHTPTRVTSQHPFRTMSAVRAMQMSSPSPSIFSSPRSIKRQPPSVSRQGTPTSLSHTISTPTKTRTPTRFKVKKEYPLVLLHVTVLPLHWYYSTMMLSTNLPPSLQSVKESWTLLQEKLGDTVLERGILIPHPQDSYEILEERLLEALELPVRPRVRILKCGHYMGPLDLDVPSSDDELFGREGDEIEVEKKWCDICRREVRFEDCATQAGEGEKRFRIKIYASNGLMRAGAWAAAWREMERVDMEIEPWVDPAQVKVMKNFSSTQNMAESTQEEEFHAEVFEPVEEKHNEDILAEEEALRKYMEEERMREVYGHRSPRMDSPTPTTRARPRSNVHGNSLPELMFAAFKVAMRDQKNVAITVLSVIVLLLALRPRGVPHIDQALISRPEFSMEAGADQSHATVAPENEPIVGKSHIVVEIPAKVADMVKEVERDTPMLAIKDDMVAEDHIQDSAPKQAPLAAAPPMPKPVPVETVDASDQTEPVA